MTKTSPKRERKTAMLYLPPHARMVVEPRAIVYIQNQDEEHNVGHGVRSYEAKLVRSNRWIIEGSGKSWMTIPSLMARVF